MTHLRAGLLLCLGIFLVGSAPTAAAAASTPAHWRRSIVRPLPLQVAQIQRDADYLQDHKSYFNPALGLIALGVGALMGLAWIFGGELALRLRGDPLPKPVRNRLDRLDAVRLAVIAAVRAAKAARRDLELSREKQLYEAVAAAIDSLLDKIRQDLLLNSVDEDYLIPALDDLADRARTLSFQLRRIAPVPTLDGDEKTMIPFGQATLSRINRRWERALARGSTKLTTIQQLISMRWPAWSRV